DLVAAANLLGDAAIVNDRRAAMPVMAVHDHFILAGIMAVPVAVMMIHVHADADRARAHIHILRARRHCERHARGRQKSDCQFPHLRSPLGFPRVRKTTDRFAGSAISAGEPDSKFTELRNRSAPSGTMRQRWEEIG